MAGAVNTIGQSKRGGGDRSSRPAQLQARENEQKALSLWIKGATFQQIAAAGFGIATASGAWRSVGRALARIPKQEADQAREAQRARLQAVRMLLWNQASADPIRAAEALIKIEAREARLLGARHADEGCGDRSGWRNTLGDHPAGDGEGGPGRWR